MLRTRSARSSKRWLLEAAALVTSYRELATTASVTALRTSEDRMEVEVLQAAIAAALPATLAAMASVTALMTSVTLGKVVMLTDSEACEIVETASMVETEPMAYEAHESLRRN